MSRKDDDLPGKAGRYRFLYETWARLKRTGSVSTGSILFDIELLEFLGPWTRDWKRCFEEHLERVKKQEACKEDLLKLVKAVGFWTFDQYSFIRKQLV